MNADDMTREELIAHYEHRIACERQSHADRLEAEKRAFALWRERLGPNWAKRMTEEQIESILMAIDSATCRPHLDKEQLAIEIDTINAHINKRDYPDKKMAINLAGATIELLLRVTEGA